MAIALGAELRESVHRANPWWRGERMPTLPAFRRWPFARMLRHADPASRPVAPLLSLRGPRQIGKTTLGLQVIAELLDGGYPPDHILRAQFDDLPSLKGLPQEAILRVLEYFEDEILPGGFNEAAHRGRPAILFVDEAQNVPDWHIQLKTAVERATVRGFVTGSSALRIELGRDSLAGRLSSLEVGPLRLHEIAAITGAGGVEPFQRENGAEEWREPDFWRELERHAAAQHGLDAAFATFSGRGGYPAAVVSDAPAGEIKEALLENVVRRVIRHDLRIGMRGMRRDPALLEEIFRLACRYAGQSPAPETLAREAGSSLDGDIGVGRVRSYLQFLDGALLLKLVEPLEMRLRRRKGHAKLAICDHLLREAILLERVPLLGSDEVEATLAGHVVESLVAYYLSSLPGVGVTHHPARAGEPEVDLVVALGDRRLPIEVKMRRSIESGRDGANLHAFVGKAANRAPFGLLVTPGPVGPMGHDVVPVSLPALLLVR